MAKCQLWAGETANAGVEAPGAHDAEWRAKTIAGRKPEVGTGRQGRKVKSVSDQRAAATTNEGQGSEGATSDSNGYRRPRARDAGRPEP